MIDILSKPADQIGLREIQSLIDSRVPENEQIEFKESLSTQDGSPDKWYCKQNGIGDRARNQILEEAVAFANAYGGVLLLGIGESKEKPPVAGRISPIPCCSDLAERLKMVFRDCVEPPIPGIEVFAVPMEGKDGVVLIRVGRSRLSPHRITTTLVCPIRRQDRCEKMTMREIQDMTLNVHRGLERLEKKFSDRSERFNQEFQSLVCRSNAFGIRTTAIPVGDDVRFEHVYHHSRIAEDLIEKWDDVVIRNDRGDHVIHDDIIIPSSHFRPILRAARSEGNIDQYNDIKLIHNNYREIHCDGLVEYGFVSCLLDQSGNALLASPDWPVIFFANLVAQANHLRRKAGTPMAEYAIDVEIYIKGLFEIKNYKYSCVFGVPERIRMKPMKYPRYLLDDPEEISRLISLFYRDFWNSVGEDVNVKEVTLSRNLISS